MKKSMIKCLTCFTARGSRRCVQEENDYIDPRIDGRRFLIRVHDRPTAEPKLVEITEHHLRLFGRVDFEEQRDGAMHGWHGDG